MTTASEPVQLSADGLDTRRYATLSPLEQLERLEADIRRLDEYERGMREAELVVPKKDGGR